MYLVWNLFVLLAFLQNKKRAQNVPTERTATKRNYFLPIKCSYGTRRPYFVKMIDLKFISGLCPLFDHSISKY